MRLRRSITVQAVPRRWFEDFVAELHGAIEGIRTEGVRVTDGAIATEFGQVQGIRLVEGRHPFAGARYRLERPGRDESDDWTGELHVTAWDREGETIVEFTGSDRTGTTSNTLRFDSAARPRTCAVTGRYRGPGWLRRASWECHADLEQWWDQADGPRRSPAAAPVTATLSHPFVTADLEIVPRRERDGRWSVRVSLAVRGRSLARPLVAVAGLLGRGVLRREFADVLGAVRSSWDEEVPALIREDPPHAVEQWLRSLTADHGPQS